jgi:hypothetical protein
MRIKLTLCYLAIPQNPRIPESQTHTRLEFSDGITLTQNWKVAGFTTSLLKGRRVELTELCGSLSGFVKDAEMIGSDLKLTLEGIWTGSPLSFEDSVSSLGKFTYGDIIVIKGPYVLPEEELEGIPLEKYRERQEILRTLNPRNIEAVEWRLMTRENIPPEVWQLWWSALRQTITTPVSWYQTIHQMSATQLRLDKLKDQPMFFGCEDVGKTLSINGVRAWNRNIQIDATNKLTWWVTVATVRGEVMDLQVDEAVYESLTEAALVNCDWECTNLPVLQTILERLEL